MQNKIQTFGFLFVIHAQANKLIDYLEKQPTSDQGEHERHDDTENLNVKLSAHRADTIRETVSTEDTQRWCGKDTNQDRTQNAADTVHGENIEAVVDLECIFECDRRKVANHTGR